MAEKVEIVIGAQDKFSGAFAKLTSLLPSVKTLALGAGAAVAGLGAGLVAMTKSTAAAHDKIQKFSDRIGISTEALSKYHHVAEMSGVTTQQLNMGFQRMTRRISEAAQGTGVAGKALAELGISIDQIAGLSPDRQFEVIAGAMQAVAHQSDKARLAMQFFDSEGVALLQTMTAGTAGLEAMKAEAEKFGLVVSKRAGANAAAFNDSLSRMSGSMRGLKNFMAEELMPTLTGLANRFAHFVANNRGEIIAFGLKAVEVFGKLAEYGGYAVAVLIDSFRGLQMVWQTLKLGFAEFSAFVIGGLADLGDKVVMFMERLNFRGIFDEAIIAAQGFTEANRTAVANMQAMSTAAWQELNRIVDQGAAVDKVQAFVATVKNALAEIRAEGDVGSNSEDGEDDGPQGVPPFTNANKAKTEENMQHLRELYNEYFLSEAERLDVWYQEQQKKYKDNEEALTTLTKIYEKRRSNIKAKEAATQAKQQKQDNKAATKETDDFYGNLNALGTLFGKKGVLIAKAAALPQAIMDTYAGAAKALRLPFPKNLAAAAAVLATGFGYVTNIKSQAFGAAHGGLDYVPREQTYLLDRGERVLSPNQNKDLTAFLGRQASEAASMQVTVNLNIAGNDFAGWGRWEWDEYVQDNIVPAMRRLASAGITV